MSSRSWSVKGKGFFLDDSKVEEILKFFDNHKDGIANCLSSCAYEKFIEVVERHLSQQDFSEEALEELDEVECYPVVIGAVINYETDMFGFEGNLGCGDTDVDSNVLYTPLYPWSMKENDRNATEAEIEGILKRYASELGVDPNAVEDHDLEYFG